MRHAVIEDLVAQTCAGKGSYADQWDIDGLTAALSDKLNLDLPIADWAGEEGVDHQVLHDRILLASNALMDDKEKAFSASTMRAIEKQFLLQVIDGKWREHIVTLDHLRSAVNFRGLAQRDPLNEYKSEAFVLFEHMLGVLREDVTRQLSRIRPLTPEEQQTEMMQQMQLQAAAARDDGRLERADGPAAPLTAGPAAPAGTARARFRRERCCHLGQPRPQ